LERAIDLQPCDWQKEREELDDITTELELADEDESVP
jgi:hypothetical protein